MVIARRDANNNIKYYTGKSWTKYKSKAKIIKEKQFHKLFKILDSFGKKDKNYKYIYFLVQANK